MDLSTKHLGVVVGFSAVQAIAEGGENPEVWVDSGGAMQGYGLSDEVKNVYSTRDFMLVFGRLGLKVDSMTAFDTTKISRDDGTEVSGFLGAPVLNRLALHIDSRDNLVKFDYDPKNDPAVYQRHFR